MEKRRADHDCLWNEPDCSECKRERAEYARNQPQGHAFKDTDGDGLCDYETDFPALERRCLNGREAHREEA